jgi:hypothetical protein
MVAPTNHSCGCISYAPKDISRHPFKAASSGHFKVSPRQTAARSNTLHGSPTTCFAFVSLALSRALSRVIKPAIAVAAFPRFGELAWLAEFSREADSGWGCCLVSAVRAPRSAIRSNCGARRSAAPKSSRRFSSGGPAICVRTNTRKVRTAASKCIASSMDRRNPANPHQSGPSRGPRSSSSCLARGQRPIRQPRRQQGRQIARARASSTPHRPRNVRRPPLRTISLRAGT